MFELGSYVACICEGGAEEAIIDILLDNNLLKFEREQLIEEKVLRTRDAASFECKHLRMGFEGKITVFRILDSRRENFKLSKAYRHKVDVINVITASEIEMLIILSENKYKEYKKFKDKPSVFCKSVLGYHSTKSKEFVTDYFSNPAVLIDAIRKYVSVSKIQKGESTLLDLLK